MIKFDQVKLTYPNGSTALECVDIDIKKGELIIITGPSGSGKTSLLKLMMGMEKPTNGTVTIDGNTLVNHEETLMKVRRNIGPIFQDLRLIKGKTALENVMLGMRFYGYDQGFMERASEEALEVVGLAEKKDRYIENLSWGETQRVAIARAVARKPSYIIADEPTGSLDESNAINILNLLAQFRNDETAVIITTHATHLIDAFKDARLIKIQEGVLESENLTTRESL